MEDNSLEASVESVHFRKKMAISKLPTTLFISLAIYLLVTQLKQQASAAPGIPANTENTHRSRSRPFVRLAGRPISPYLRIKPELNDFIADEDDFYELNKRQTSDDYGHLRFGKRDEFDDYGHMRFGRSSPDSNVRK